MARAPGPALRSRREPHDLARAEGRRRARRALTVSAGSRRAGLTGRERQILELVALGRTNGSIARTLEVRPRTVAKHLEHIYRKLGVSGRAEHSARTVVRLLVGRDPDVALAHPLARRGQGTARRGQGTARRTRGTSGP
jgi:DNA-binding CsgD family transcriptional regulator